VSFAIGILPQDVPRGVAVTAPDEVDKAFDKFVALGDYTGPCLTEFKWSDLSDFQIEMQIDDAGTLFLLRNKDGQLVKNRYAAGKKMCVVAGELRSTDVIFAGNSNSKIATIDSKGKVTQGQYFEGMKEAFSYTDKNVVWPAKHFWANWMVDLGEAGDESTLKFTSFRPIRKRNVRIAAPDYALVSKLLIGKNKKEMEVFYLSEPDKSVSLKKNDGGLLYVPESGRVCLFGTNYAFQANDEGIKDNYLNKEKEEYIFGRTLQECPKGR